MKRTIISALAVTGLLIGCEPVPHYNRVQVASLTGQPAEVPVKQQGKVRPYGSVKLFQSKEEVPGKYQVIGIMSVEGKAGEEARFITAFLYRAADMGADAIILYRVSLTSDLKGGGSGFIANGQGAFGLGAPIETVHNAVYRAEAIRFQ
jgi:hypothetical protein